MSAGAPWSVKGIDPKAREIAKDLARRSGMTLGEWLNQVILEDGEDEPAAPISYRPTSFDTASDRRPRVNPRTGRGYEDAYEAPPSPPHVRARDEGEMDRVTRALEALSARVEAAENRSTLAVSGVNQAVAGLLARLETAEIDQSSTSARIEHVSEDLRDEQGRALDRIRLVERELENPRGLEALQALETALGKIANQVYEGETRNRVSLDEMRNDLTASLRRVDRLEASGGTSAGEAQAMVEGVVSRIAERLEQAEARTTGAIRTLEASFGHLDERMRATESHLDDSRESRFERLAEELGARVEESRAELLQRIDSVGEHRFDHVERALNDLSGHVQASEQRSADAIEKMGNEVLRIAQNLNGRMNGVERSGARYDRASGEIAERIRQSEERTTRLLEEARDTLDRSIARADQRAAAQAVSDLPAAEAAPAALVAAPVAEAAPAPRGPEPADWAAPATGYSESARESIFDEPAPAFPSFPEQTRGVAAFEDVFAEAAADVPVEAPVYEAPAYAPPVYEAPVYEKPAAREPEPEFDEFSAETEFVNPETAPGASPVSTKDAIDAARAAARLGVRDRKDSGGGFLGMGKKKDKEPKREGSTVKKALFSSAVAVIAVSTVVGGALVQREGETADSLDIASLIDRPVKSDPKPLAAVVLSPQLLDPTTTANNAEGAKLYDEATVQLSAKQDGAVDTLLKAANLGYAPAQFHLGKLYETGESGVRKDLAEARRWTERAAIGGERRAMHNLGLYAFDGVGGPKDLPTAAKWFEKAAQLGLVDSQYNLGRLYEQGLGVPQNGREAYEWYLIASNAGDDESRAAADQLRTKITATDRAAAERAATAFRSTDPEPATLASR
jgi:localization factor PodJL